MRQDYNRGAQALAQFKDQLTAKVGDLTKNLPGNVGAAATQMIADPKNLQKDAPKVTEDTLKGLLGGADKKKKQPATMKTAHVTSRFPCGAIPAATSERMIAAPISRIGW